MIDVQKYKAMGYSDQEIYSAYNELRQESGLQQSYATAMNQSTMMPQTANTIIAGQMNQENLIKWQLELDSILERIEHILRGDKPTMINGNMVFIPATDDKNKIFNDYGVSEIMRILSIYLNRNTILSNYDEDTINWKVLDFGKEVSDLIFLKYEEMGLDTLEKRKRYPMIVREIVDAVHSSFLRALNGGERDSLRQARNIVQNENIGQNQQQIYNMKERSLINPMRYIFGKYK